MMNFAKSGWCVASGIPAGTVTGNDGSSLVSGEDPLLPPHVKNCGIRSEDHPCEHRFAREASENLMRYGRSIRQLSRSCSLQPRVIKGRGNYVVVRSEERRVGKERRRRGWREY